MFRGDIFQTGSVRDVPDNFQFLGRAVDQVKMYLREHDSQWYAGKTAAGAGIQYPCLRFERDDLCNRQGM